MKYNSMRVKQMKTRREYLRITAIDISEKQFPIVSEGLDPEEVYAFLEVIREEMYEREKENLLLKQMVARMRDKAKIVDLRP